MLRRDIDEDLFKDSTMTFGQHLEELRGALFRSLLGVAITLMIGLWQGDRVVAVIKSPLERALGNYYQDQSTAVVAEPGASAETQKQIKEYLQKEGLLTERVYLDPHQLLEQLKQAYPQAAEPLNAALAPDTTSGASKPASAVTAEQASSLAVPDALPPPREQMLQLTLFRPQDKDPRIHPMSLGTSEAFSIYMKASLLVALVLAAPWIFYQIWTFVAAGLYPHEKRYVHVFLPISVGLFLGGVALAFFFVFQPVLDFLLSFNQWLGIDPNPRISEWLSFVLILPLGFGIAFQLPLVMLFLERIGVFNVQVYLSYWRVSVLVIFIIAMILTPSDPYSMLLMAIPLTFLYFGGALLCKLMPRMRSPYDDALVGTRN